MKKLINVRDYILKTTCHYKSRVKIYFLNVHFSIFILTTKLNGYALIFIPSLKSILTGSLVICNEVEYLQKKKMSMKCRNLKYW